MYTNIFCLRRLYMLICRRKGRLCVGFILLVLMCFVVLITTISLHRRCSNTQSQQFIHKLCDDYRQGLIAGSMCSDMCDSTNIQYEGCINYHAGKTVMFMKCKQCDDQASRIVLKCGLKEEEERSVFVLNEFLTPERIIRDIVSFHTGIIQMNRTDILSYMWGTNFTLYLSANKKVPDVKKIAIKSVLSLVSQNEYLLMRLFQEYSFMPKIYGTCGPAYFLEFTKSLEDRSFWIFQKTFSWQNQVKVALKLLDLIDYIDNQLKYPLHLCDVKVDNFGIRSNGDVTLIDVDTAFYDPILKSQMLSQPCAMDSNCDFFDCKGRCSITNGTCSPERVNNNLQSLCEKVLVLRLGGIEMGLLRNPPYNSKDAIRQLLDECENLPTRGVSGQTRASTSNDIANRLRKILKNSLKHSSLEANSRRHV